MVVLAILVFLLIGTLVPGGTRWGPWASVASSMRCQGDVTERSRADRLRKRLFDDCWFDFAA